MVRWLLSGPGYEVREAVRNGGFSNFYFVKTPDGTFEIESRDLLEIRTQEFRALAIMKEVSGTPPWARQPRDRSCWPRT